MVKKINYLKAGFAVVMAVYGIVLMSDVTEYRFLDRVDLVIHEAGHLLFGWLGEFMMVIGGTLGQLLVPAGIAVYFFLRQELFSASVVLFWIGQNFFNISVYVKDAQAMAMPLVSVGGGEDTIHDWNYLLRAFGLLRYDQTVGTLVYVLGMVILIAAVLAAFYLSVDREDAEAAQA